jgi:RND family efflux transporter MFP subunit
MKEKNMKSVNKKYIKYLFIFSLILILAFTVFNINACRQEEPELETFIVTRGDIIETISSTGTVDSTEMINYSVLQTAEILEILKKGDSFKKGQTLMKIDNSKNELYIEQAEQNLILAEQAIDVALINYQSALDANHFAVQLAETNTKMAEESTASAFIALENANRSADQAYESASTALENTTNISSWSITAAKSSLEEAERILQEAKNNPGVTPEQLAQYEYNVKAAEETYELTKAQQQANNDTAQEGIESSKIQGDYSAESAESVYRQSLINQSTTYWTNLSSLYSAEDQIGLTAENIAQAETQLELSKINLELAKLDMDTFHVAAQFDGTVLAANFSEGEYISPGIAGLTVISDEYVVKSDINETDIAKVETGQAVELTFDAYPEMEFNGDITDISPISKNIAGIVTFEITVRPDSDAEEYLKYGLSANLTILISDTRGVLYVPIQSVYEEDGKEYVDVLTRENQIKKAEITTGNYNYDYIEILSGLAEGDTVILSRVDIDQIEQGGGFGFFNRD